jgi:hypothetical protein
MRRVQLRRFVETFGARRSFGGVSGGGAASAASDFGALFETLLSCRFTRTEWWSVAPEAHKLRVLQALRLLIREPTMQTQWADVDGLTPVFAERFRWYAESHCGAVEVEFSVHILVEFAAIAKRLCAYPGAALKDDLARSSVPRTLVLLLRSDDGVVLHSVVVALVHLAMEGAMRAQLSSLDCVGILLPHLRVRSMHFTPRLRGFDTEPVC